jgi:outer membrane protein OmpA-like peptidoglycan-associated protein
VTPPLDIAGLPPPPMPLVHEAIRHAALDVPSTTDENQRADEASTSGIETGAVTRTQDSAPAEDHSAQSSSEAAASESPDVKIVTLEEPADAAVEAPATPSQEQDIAALGTNEAPVEAAAAEPEQQPQTAAPSPEQAAATLNTNEGAVQAAAAETQPQAAAAPVQTAALEPAPQADACADAFAEALDGTTINFARASAVIQKESRPLLDKLAAIAKRCKGYRLTVEGHTDLTGSRAANLSLSKKRAEAVRWALIDRGIDMDHIAAEGFGASRPLENATSDDANAKNRRIAVTVSEASRSTKRAAQ